MTSNKAPIDLLEQLHGSLAEQLMEKIQSGEATASDYNVARQFLKDNNIDAIANEGSPLDSLRNALPFKSEEELHEQQSVLN